MKGFVRASTQADVDYLSNNLRTEDAQEVLASHGGSVEALQLGLNNSEEYALSVLNLVNIFHLKHVISFSPYSLRYGERSETTLQSPD